MPGEFRNQLRRLIVTQGDTEPASVEQQRLLGQRCPSLYDLRNLFQVNVEEGRHLWAMVYLLHSYFGRDGRDEAEELLERQSGNRDKPRILDAFNEPIDNWLDFFMFTMFTDRDGKSQLMSLSESSLDPLSRTTRFMLTEEAHHMFVGETGIARILERTCQLMKTAGFSEDVRKVGGIDIPTIQKHLNLWFSLSLDLHGSEVSSNAAVVLRQRPQGARQGRHLRRARRQERATTTWSSSRTASRSTKDSPDAQRDERSAARLVRRRLRRRRRRAGTGSSSATACRIGCGCPIASSTAASACIAGFHFDPNGVPLSRRAVGAAQVRVAAVGGGHANTCSASWRSRCTSRASSPTTSRRRGAASTSSRSTSSTSGRSSRSRRRGTSMNPLSFTWLGHATFLFRSPGGKRILTRSVDCGEPVNARVGEEGRRRSI